MVFRSKFAILILLFIPLNGFSSENPPTTDELPREIREKIDSRLDDYVSKSRRALEKLSKVIQPGKHLKAEQIETIFRGHCKELVNLRKELKSQLNELHKKQVEELNGNNPLSLQLSIRPLTRFYQSEADSWKAICDEARKMALLHNEITQATDQIMQTSFRVTAAWEKAKTNLSLIDRLHPKVQEKRKQLTGKVEDALDDLVSKESTTTAAPTSDGSPGGQAVANLVKGLYGHFEMLKTRADMHVAFIGIKRPLFIKLSKKLNEENYKERIDKLKELPEVFKDEPGEEVFQKFWNSWAKTMQAQLQYYSKAYGEYLKRTEPLIEKNFPSDFSHIKHLRQENIDEEVEKEIELVHGACMNFLRGIEKSDISKESEIKQLYEEAKGLCEKTKNLKD